MSECTDPKIHIKKFLKHLTVYLKNIKIYFLRYNTNNKLEFSFGQINNDMINLQPLINHYNEVLITLEVYINLSLRIYNQILNWNIKYAKFRTIELNNYYFPVSLETRNIIKMLENNIIDLYKKSIFITKFIPKLKSPDIIEKEIYDELIKKYKL